MLNILHSPNSGRSLSLAVTNELSFELKIPNESPCVSVTNAPDTPPLTSTGVVTLYW
ncbi:Uncharacterised protein, partial [Mycoplasmopsis synoviae]